VEAGAAERDDMLRRQIAVMDPGRFEQLVFELAHRENPKVRRLKHPDGGADTLLPEEPSRQAEVWQAKRYPDGINWQECEDSLDSAIERWKPARMIFALPRDLSEVLEDSFKTRLVDPGRKRGINVELWNLSELVRRLTDHTDLKVRFFGKEQEGLVDAVLRAAQVGGELHDANDLVKRAEALSDFAEQQDRDFTYSITSAAASTPVPQWENSPHLRMTVIGGGRQATVAAWPREGSDVGASFWFIDDDTGRAARQEALEHWARGEEAVVTEGAQIQFSTPELMRQLMPDPETLGCGGSLRIPAATAFEASLEVTAGGETHMRHFEVRPVPPRPGAYGALAGYAGSVLMEVNFRARDDETVGADFSLHSRFSPDAHESAEAAALMHAWCTHEHVRFHSTTVFPNGIEGDSHVPETPEAVEEMGWRKEFYADVAYLEDQLGVELPLPEETTREDLAAVRTAAMVLRSGEGTGTFEEATAFVQNPLEIPGIPDQFAKAGTVRRMVSYPVFGRELQLGFADYEIPPVRIVNIIPYGQTPTSPARVVIGPDSSDQMTFRLVNHEANQ
jgi:hypothetical protein